jgi:hypothetical protein
MRVIIKHYANDQPENQLYLGKESRTVWRLVFEHLVLLSSFQKVGNRGDRAMGVSPTNYDVCVCIYNYVLVCVYGCVFQLCVCTRVYVCVCT